MVFWGSDRCFAPVSQLSTVIPNNLQCGTQWRLGKGPVNFFLLRIIPSHFLGCGTKEFCLRQLTSSSRALLSFNITSPTELPMQQIVVSSAYI